MFGVHIPKGNYKTLEEAILTAHQKDGFNAGQIFLWVPQKLQPIDHDPQKIKQIAKTMNLYIHTSYLISPWSQAKYNIPLTLKQLHQQVEIGAKGVIFHIPNKPAKDLIGPLKFIINKKPKGSHFLMENKAYKMIENSHATPQQLNNMTDVFISAGIPLNEINYAIDTAHLHAAGQEISTYKQMYDWLKGLKYPNTIKLFHLNGNSGKGFQDVHEIIFTKNDNIWHGIPYQDSGVRAINEFAKLHKIDIIIECKYNLPNDRLNSIKIVKYILNPTKN
jgi:endonuclease IV